MTNTKLTVKFLIPGSKPYTNEECKEEKLPNAGFDNHSFNTFQKESIKRVNYTTNRCIPAVQVINICEEAYYDMLDNPPIGYRGFNYKKLPVTIRLQAHLDLLKYELKAYDYTYYITKD